METREDHVYFTIVIKTEKNRIKTTVFGVKKEIARPYVEGRKTPVELYYDELGFEYSYDKANGIITWKYPFVKKGYENTVKSVFVEEILSQGFCNLTNIHISECPAALKSKSEKEAI